MEAQTAHPPSGPSSGAYPRWVMLERRCYCSIGVGNSSCSTADAKTQAAARTSTGHMIQVSLSLAEPLSTSSLCVQVSDGVEVQKHNCKVLAAHGDSVLIVVPVLDENHQYYYYKADHFVYNAGDAAADPPRPPSLSLLPPLYQYHTEEEEEEEDEEEEEENPAPRDLAAFAIGLLRRGEDELVVAGLRTGCSVEDAPELKLAELCLFRSGEWSVRRLPIDGDASEGWDELPSVWHTAVLPVGDRQLCWVHFSRDVLVICDDVFEESPRLRYLRLPMDPRLGSLSNRNVCTTAGDRVLKFVNIFPRCCCGGAGASCCKRSLHAYTIHTWMLRMDDMEWIKDGMVDATELWALDAYKGLPRVPLECPVVSMYEPNVIYFQLRESYHVKNCIDDTIWLLKVDMRSKTIQSFNGDGLSCMLHKLIPSDVSQFFYTYPSNASDGALTEQRQMGIERPPIVVVDEQTVREDDANNPMLQSSSFMEPSDQASEIFEALLQISRYGLDGDELKAYSILVQDNGRLFRSLLRLPKNMRKDWLLMEIIKASQAY
ncbi:unnamed protein product [Miscanthus lutarioriparius]|uniref:DUF1618 domain-containing protein n=1 Tax=Miscanthus lutarioriparius TaxID=422564 RepID=A0A811QME3_9POAL|nr:unnamed protein product [Miscanthus lutarioriparius]